MRHMSQTAPSLVTPTKAASVDLATKSRPGPSVGPIVLAMSDITITPWTHDGLLRGYAIAPDGTSLGWIDACIGELSLHAPATDIETVASALRSWARMPDASRTIA